MGRQQIDQTIKTGNFKARNERFETGSLVNSHTGRNVSAEGSGENVLSGQQLDSAQEETPVVSVTGKPQETDAIADTDHVPVKERLLLENADPDGRKKAL